MMTHKNTPKKAYSYIRFSSAMQAKGDSYRRQSELSKNWASKNGYEIVDNMRDLGLSAYKGNHKKNGALGVFIEKIKSGDIEEGSVLLVESLDRLSREQIIVAMNQLHNIVNAGIDVVTLLDNYHYTKETISDIGNMMYSLMIMHRAYEESNTKSQRLLQSWENKIQNASKRPVTSKCPHWLQYNFESEKFELIPERAAIVREIFDMTINGFGRRLIAKKLNSRNEQTWHGGAIWHDSYVNKILENKATYGIYIPRKNGDEVENYYPPAISRETFFLAKSKRSSRKAKGGRPSPQGFGNLFKNMSRCIDCGGSMRRINKGKSWVYLACNNAISSGPCKSIRKWSYSDIELPILLAFAESLNLNWFSALLDETNQNEHKLKQQQESLKMELKATQDQLENLGNAISLSKSENISVLTSKFDTISKKESDISEQLKQLDKDFENEQMNLKSLFQEDLDKSIYKLLSETDEEATYSYKQKVHQSLIEAGAKIGFTDNFGPDSQGAIFINARGLKPKLVLVDEIYDSIVETAKLKSLIVQQEGDKMAIESYEKIIKALNNEKLEIELELKEIEKLMTN